MDKTEHVLLAGEGAQAFADENGVTKATYDELLTDLAQLKLKNHLQQISKLNDFEFIQ